MTILALQILACIGFGMPLLRLCGVAAGLTRAEQVCWSFALGMGTLGWLVFFVGVGGSLTPGPLAALLATGTAGLLAFKGAPARPAPQAPLTRIEWMLLAVLAVVLAASLTQGLSPPADADSMAYHFDMPKRFLAEGRVFFVPRAMDGAVPLLVHMTYATALGLGGETALTLWTMASGWMAGALLYTLARRHLERGWALAVALLFLTTPAVVFGAGSGQVEVRNALFVIVAAASLRTGRLGATAIAGLAIGFFMGGKLLGLEFALAAGLVLLAQRRWLAHGMVFGLAALVAGGQWYAWNWLNSGDPVFPMLYGLVPYTDATFWNAAHHERLLTMLREVERAVPVSLGWLLTYPFAATLAGKPVFEAGRTGFGPFVLLALPFALAGIWRLRQRLRSSPLLPLAAVTALFYAIWFLVGSSQRLRHLLPVYPLLLLCVMVAAQRWGRGIRPLAGAVAVTLLLQLGGLAVFSANFARHLISGESRDAFLARNLSLYAPVPWINANLSPQDKVFSYLRWTNYAIEVPVFFAQITQEARVDIAPSADPKLFYQQLRREGVTHLLVTEGRDEPPFPWWGLRRMGCLDPLQRFEGAVWGSRTLGTDAGTTRADLYQLGPPTCLER